VNVDTPVVIAFRGGNGALAAARTLGRMGVRVYYAGQKGALYVEESRYWTDRFWWDFDAPREETFQYFVRVAQTIGARPILLAVTDWTAMFVDEYADRLSEYYDFSRAAPGTLERLVSKWGMFGAANALGIPTPKTWLPRTREDVLEFLESASFPVIVKAADPSAPKPPPKAIVGDARELLRIFDEAGSEPNLIFQEHIPGGADQVWMCNAYLDGAARCRAVYTGRKLRQVHDMGIASLAVTEPNPTVADQTRRLLEGLGYRGLAGVGYKYDPRDGGYKLLDVNARLSGVFRLYGATDGMDVVRLSYLDLTGQPLPPQPKVLSGRKWMLEQDILAARECMREGTLTFWQWLKSMQGVRETHWFAFDDPRPGIEWFKKNVGPSLSLRRLLRRKQRAERNVLAGDSVSR
jgi:predicted ATP-grasp superfamily ATP-dependent carboligase